jgi:hypothetical protein
MVISQGIWDGFPDAQQAARPISHRLPAVWAQPRRLPATYPERCLNAYKPFTAFSPVLDLAGGLTLRGIPA